MTTLFSLASLLDHALRLSHGVSTSTLTTIKSIVATVLLGLALTQALEQALLYRWLRVRNLNRRLVVRLHRFGGVTVVLLVLTVLGLCWYTWLGLGYPPSTVRVVAHAVLGGLLSVVLLAKLAIANLFRQYLGYTLPLGISAATLLLCIFLLTALPHFVGRF